MRIGLDKLFLASAAVAVVGVMGASQVFGAETLKCIIDQTHTTPEGVADGIHYKNLPDLNLRVKACANPNCFFNSVELKPELFPNVSVRIEGNTDGEIFINFEDKGAINPRQGKLGYTAPSASGMTRVLATYTVFSGDSYPMRMNNVMVSCEAK